jgi:hypothetical protein
MMNVAVQGTDLPRIGEQRPRGLGRTREHAPMRCSNGPECREPPLKRYQIRERLVARGVKLGGYVANDLCRLVIAAATGINRERTRTLGPLE